MRFRSNSPDVQIGNAGTARTVVQQVAHLARDLLIACVKQHRRGVAHERPGPARDHDGTDNTHDRIEPDPAAISTGQRSEERTSELQSLMRISYSEFCFQKKKTNITHHNTFSPSLNKTYL